VVLLDTLFADVVRLLAAEHRPSQDPLAVAMGLADLGTGEDVERPTDPALIRLFPDASADDPAMAAEFRRFTERGLRRTKVEGLQAVRRTLARGEPDEELRLRLDDDDARAWVVALTDLRLVLADRLGVRTDADAEALHARVARSEHSSDDPDDPDAPEPDEWLAMVYDFVSWLQESLTEVLLATLPARGDGRRPVPPGLDE